MIFHLELGREEDTRLGAAVHDCHACPHHPQSQFAVISLSRAAENLQAHGKALQRLGHSDTATLSESAMGASSLLDSAECAATVSRASTRTAALRSGQAKMEEAHETGRQAQAPT